MDFEKYGLPGIGIGLLIIAIRWAAVFIKDLLKEHKAEREELERQHRIERDDWNKTIEKQFDDSNKVTNSATAALTELTTLLKNKK